MRDAVFVFSTGRCGTQWLAKVLLESYGDRLRVEHEPLLGRIEPRAALGHEPGKSDADFSEALRKHASEIQGWLGTGGYVECGHVGWSVLPHLCLLLRGRVRVVHLVRHPVYTAISWLTHGVYQPQLTPHLAERELLSPYDPGVRFPAYRERWNALTPYDKCLYYWLEVNSLGMELQSRGEVPWLRLRTEDLFLSDGWEELRTFLELPAGGRPEPARHEVVDQFHYLSASRPDWRQVEAHEEVLRLMARFGYRLDEVDEEALHKRYLGWPA